MSALKFSPLVDLKSEWDPFLVHEAGTLTATASSRIKRDLMNLFTDPPFGVFAVGDENDMRIIHALVVGVMDTPYEGGFFYFVMKCPNDYPIHPPKVKLMTTDAGRVRFNPNFYKNGKVCISILGTWEGPAWTPAQQLSSLLISIQSLMNNNPYFNEPGLKTESVPGEAQNYAEMIRHETLRAAVCGMVENECRLNMPQELRRIMEKSFLEFYDQYVETVDQKLHLDGRIMIDPFTKNKYPFHYAKIKERLTALHDSLSKKYTAAHEDSLSDSSSSS